MIYFFLLSVFVATLGGERGAGLGVECCCSVHVLLSSAGIGIGIGIGTGIVIKSCCYLL